MSQQSVQITLQSFTPSHGRDFLQISHDFALMPVGRSRLGALSTMGGVDFDGNDDVDVSVGDDDGGGTGGADGPR